MIKSQELQTAIQAAQAGSSIVRQFAEKGFSKSTKTVGIENQGLVTEADLEAEKAIVDTIRAEFPSHSFLAEESYDDDRASEHLWVIDPLDGTNNFACGIPRFGISVAYCKHGEALCGVVINPLTEEVFLVEKGRGAFHDGRPASVNENAELEGTMISTGFYYDRGQMMKSTLRAIENLFHKNVLGVRRFGAATLDLIDVGLGRYGAFFELTLSPWDYAAAKLFIEEAGGKVTDCDGNPLTLNKTSVLATNGQLHALMLETINKQG